MRTTSVSFLALLALAGGGCKWTEFDDIEATAWARSVSKPDDKSTNFGGMIGRGGRNDNTFTTVGTSQMVFQQWSISATGDVSPTTPEEEGLNLTTPTSVQTFDSQAQLLADPDGDTIAFVLQGLGNEINVWHGTGAALNIVQVFGVSSPAGSTFMTPPPALSGGGTTQTPQVLVAAGDSVYGANLPMALNPQPKCTLQDETGSALTIGAVGAVRLTGSTDDVVAWVKQGTTGKLLLYPGDVFNGFAPRGPCGSQATPTITPLSNSVAVTTTFAPGPRSRIVRVDEDHVLLVGLAEGTASDAYLALYNLTAMNGPNLEPALVGSAQMVGGMKNAAVLKTADEMFVAAGFPDEIVDSNAAAGMVRLYELSTTGGIGAVRTTLHDAQPEQNQQFGRSVSVVQFNGQDILIAGADNELFVYFRTAVYDETRQ